MKLDNIPDRPRSFDEYIHDQPFEDYCIAQKIVSEAPGHEKEAWLCRNGYSHADVERAMQAVWAAAQGAREQ